MRGELSRSVRMRSALITAGRVNHPATVRFEPDEDVAVVERSRTRGLSYRVCPSGGRAGACACGQEARKMIDARVDVDVRPVSRYTIDYSHCAVYPVRMGIRRLTALGVQTKTRLVGGGGR